MNQTKLISTIVLPDATYSYCTSGEKGPKKSKYQIIEIIKRREGAGKKKKYYIQQRIMIEMSDVSPTDAEILVPFSEQYLIFYSSQYRLFSFYPSLHQISSISK